MLSLVMCDLTSDLCNLTPGLCNLTLGMCNMTPGLYNLTQDLCNLTSDRDSLEEVEAFFYPKTIQPEKTIPYDGRTEHAIHHYSVTSAGQCCASLL